MANPSLQVPYPGLPYMGQPGDALRDPPTAPIDPTLANAPVVDPTQTGLAYRDTPAPEVLTNPYAQGGAAGSFSRGIHKGIEDTIVGAKNIYGLAQVGLGYRDAAAQTFQEAKAQADQAAAEGPRTATFEQARQSGDYGGYVGGLIGESIPTLATMLIPGGVGGKIGTKIAEKGAARIAEKIGAQASERALAAGATEDAAAQAATTASTTAARRLAGTDGAKAVADVANRAGEVAGTTVGGLPGAAASNTDQLANASPDDLGDVAGKVALGTLASSAVGALPAARLLDRAGQTAVEETTKSLIPRVAKEMGVQAAVAGGAGVAQTAATLATHKWVGDNVDLLSPASFDQYLDSLIGGGVIGGVTGGLLGAMKGAHAPDVDIRKTFRDNFDRFSNRGKPVDAEEGTPSQGGADGVSVDEAPTDVPNSVKAFMDAHAELKSQSAEAAAVFNTSFKHSDDGQQSVIDALHKSYDKAETKTAKQAIMKMMSKYAEDVTPEQSGDAGFQARHDDALEGMQRDEKIDSIVNDAHASHEAFMQGADPIAGDAPRATNPVQMATPMQNMLAAHIPTDHPIWAHPDVVQSIVKSASKMLSTSEDLTPKDTRNIDIMRQLVGDRTVDKWKAVGPEFAKLTELTDKVSDGIEHAQPHAETTALDEHEPSVQTKSLADMPRTEIADRLASVDPSTPEHAELRAAFREQLKPDIVLENKKGNGPSFFASKEALPSTVEMAAQKTPYGPRRRLVDVNNMIGHELQKNPGSSATVVGKVLGDLKLAGVKIKPESIKAGTWYKSADGSSEVRVSPRQAAQLRGETPRLTDAQAKRAREQTQADIKKRRAPKKEESADQNLLEKSERENASTSSDTKPSFDEEASSGHAADKFAQGPRIDPPSGDVADIRASTPHAKTLKAATKELSAVTKGVEKAKAEGTLTPRLRGELAQKFAQVRHEAGVKIGRAELEKSEVNERTLAKKVKQLEDPKSGLSKKYFDDAKAGKFDSASVTETKPDTVKRAGQDPTSKLETKLPASATRENAPAKTGPAKLEAARAKIERQLKPADKITNSRADDEAEALHGDQEGFGATHDSPIKHDGTFNWREHKGEGEGSNKFGSGTYLSTDNQVHESYKKAFTAKVKGEQFTEENIAAHVKSWAGEFADSIGAYVRRILTKNSDTSDMKGKLERLVSNMKDGATDKFADRMAAVLKVIKSAPSDALDFISHSFEHDKTPTYQVSVKAGAHEIMDYNKPIAAQHADVQTAIKKALSDSGVKWDKTDFDKRTGKEAYDALSEKLGSTDKASDALQDAGLVGHKYAAFEGKNVEKPNYVIYDDSRIKTNYVRHDDNIAQGFRDVTGSGKNDHAKETELANALLKRLNFIGPKVKILPGALSKVEVTGGRWQSDGNIYIADHLHGPERMEVIAHELGHHVVHHELGDALENAKPELRAALQADYDRWATENHGHDRTVAEVLASRKAFFRGERIRDNATDKKATALPLDKYNYLYDMHEYLADQFARAMTQKKESQTIIGKFFSGIAAKLRAVYDGMFGAERAEYAPAESVDKWVQSLFDRNRDNVREATGQSVPKETAEHFVRAAHATMHAEDVTQGDALEANQHYVDYMLTPETRGILSRALDRRLVERQIRAAFGDDTALMKRMEGATGLATRFYLANKLFGEGKLDLGAKNPVLEPFLALRNGLFRLAGLAGNNDKALQLFTDTRNGAIERAGQHGYSVDKAVEATRKTDNARKIQETLNTANRIYRAQGFNPFRLVMYGPGSNIHYSYTTALAKVGALLKLHTGEAGGDGGYLPMRVTKKQGFYKQMDATLGALSKEDLNAVREHLQTRAQMSDIPSAVQRKAVAAMRDLYRSGFDYGRKAGLQLGDKGRDYFGVSMDKADVQKRESEFKALLSNPKFEQGFREASGFKGPRNELIDSLYKHAAGLHELSDTAVDPLAPPDFKPLNQRLMQAIYDHGTPEEVKQFASFQSKDLAEIAHNYFSGLVDKAEYTRRFGENGEKLAAIFDDAKKQGASDADIAHVRDYVAAATGAYAKDGSPIVRKLFGGDNDVTYNKAIEAAKARGASKAELDGIQRKFGDKAGDFFGSDKYRQGSGMLMAYQNIRTLPLSVLSAIADPMGIGVRYGGFRSVKDVGQAWKSLRDGFKAMSKGDRTGIRDQADIIALAGDHVVSDMMANGYAPGAEGFARKASDMFFKANGLNWFVKSTRYMALSAANAFLLKHAASLDPKHSPRYLRELGVKEGDIRTGDKGLVKLLTDDERQHATDAQLASDDRVRNALNRFVNESILRVDPSQHPIYFNDPAFRLVTQYQQFGHAFAETILDRIVHEAHFSNFHVLAPAMGYIPVTAAAEMARSFIQYGPAGNPSQANWDPLDWAAFAGDRAGLLGPRIRQGLGLVEGKAYAGMGHMVEIGPTGQQLGDVLHTLEGDRSVSSTVVESLPAGALLKHW